MSRINFPTHWLNVIRESSLKSQTKHLACVIRSYLNDDACECWPAIKTIARQMSTSNKTIIFHMKILEDEGYIYVKRTKGGFKNVNHYFIKLPDNYEIEKPLPSYTHNSERTTSETVTQLHRNKQFNKQKNKQLNKYPKKGNSYENLIDKSWADGLLTEGNNNQAID